MAHAPRRGSGATGRRERRLRSSGGAPGGGGGRSAQEEGRPGQHPKRRRRRGKGKGAVALPFGRQGQPRLSAECGAKERRSDVQLGLAPC